MENQEQAINLFNDFEVPFEPGKEYHVILAEAKAGTKDNGKNYISHTLIGLKGEKFTKSFYIDTPGGRSFYTRFISSCGIAREETTNWIPSKLNGRFINVIFHNEGYQKQIFDEYGQEAGQETKLSFKIKSFRSSSATQEIQEKLREVMNSGQPGDGCPF